MRTAFYTYDKDGNVTSFGHADLSTLVQHSMNTGTTCVPISDSKLEAELRLFHHHYKHVDGQLTRLSAAEIEVMEAKRTFVPTSDDSKYWERLEEVLVKAMKRAMSDE